MTLVVTLKAAVLHDKQTINLQYTTNIYDAATMGHCNIEAISKVAPEPEKNSHIIYPIYTGYTPNDICILDGFEQLEAEQYGPNRYILEDHPAGRRYLPWCFTNIPHPRGKPVK